MGSSGTVDSWKKQTESSIGGFFDRLKTDPLREATKIATHGMYDPGNGQWDLPFMTKQGLEFITGATGANAGRKAAMDAKTAADEQAAQIKLEAERNLKLRQTQDLQASSTAAAARKAPTLSSSAFNSSSTSVPGSSVSSKAERDFLGL